ncbi:hypothetical protein PAMC26510_06160 [Caballeronia sordidicola]|uniref:Uncharacterized protein n=1 Tax=Caballeronia sordidicola TaxID=196367 RepID=A0A242N680_CABSO|nr:hypothetical protein PAMC26510_06160 [Caballeronia sordidicola]
MIDAPAALTTLPPLYNAIAVVVLLRVEPLFRIDAELSNSRAK